MTATTCYCCERPSVGKGDHVPPIKFFPKNSFSKTKPIKVPSCAEHNENASQLDEYLKFILAAGSSAAPKEVVESASRGLVRLIKKESRTLREFGVCRVADEVFVDKSAPLKQDLLIASLKKIARGVYFHHTWHKRKLTTALDVWPIFLGSDPGATEIQRQYISEIASYTLQDLKEKETFGVDKNIFYYQVIESSELVVINLVFFTDMIVSVMSSNSSEPYARRA